MVDRKTNWFVLLGVGGGRGERGEERGEGGGSVGKFLFIYNKFVVIAGAFCLGPKGWKAPVTPGFPKAKQQPSKTYNLTTMGKY